jgi:hypothetical protein
MIRYVSRKGCEGNLSWTILKIPGNSRTLSRSMMLLKHLYSLKCCKFYCRCLGRIFVWTYDKTVLEELVPYFSFTTYLVFDTKRTAYKSSSQRVIQLVLLRVYSLHRNVFAETLPSNGPHFSLNYSVLLGGGTQTHETK